MLGLPDHRSIDEALGPPVLLKRLGNALEANLARTRLESAGIPSFVVGRDAFASDRSTPIGLFVPERCVADALDLLDRPPVDADVDDSGFDDPGRPLAFRALVASVAGWTIVFLTVVGLVLAALAFGYAILLAVRAIRVSTHGDRGLRLQVVASIALALLGLAMTAALGLYLMSPR